MPKEIAIVIDGGEGELEFKEEVSDEFEGEPTCCHTRSDLRRLISIRKQGSAKRSGEATRGRCGPGDLVLLVNSDRDPCRTLEYPLLSTSSSLPHRCLNTPPIQQPSLSPTAQSQPQLYNHETQTTRRLCPKEGYFPSIEGTGDVCT